MGTTVDYKVLREAQSKLTVDFLDNVTINVDYEMSESERDVIAKLFNKSVLYAPRKTSAHPIPAFLSGYANKKLDPLRVDAIEIGPNPTASIHPAYGISTILDARDEKRHIEHATTLSRRTNREDFQTKFVEAWADSERRNERMDFNGIDQCRFKATHAVALHSLYDI